jgi:hypothetical protein
VEPSSTPAVDIAPQPGEMSSLASFSPAAEEMQDNNLFRPVTRAHGHRTTRQRNAFLQTPGPLPIVIVNKFPNGFALDPSLSDEDVTDNTHLTGDVAPTACGGVSDTSADPTNFQALLDNTWPPQDPDPTSSLWAFASTSCKILDNAIHSFCQEIHDHDQVINAIVQELQADRINPDSFVSTQDLASRIQMSVTDMVNPLHTALLAIMDAMQRSYGALLSKYGSMLERSHALGMDQERRLDLNETCLDDSSAKRATLQATLATLSTSMDVKLTEVAATTASAVSHVAQVASMVNSFDNTLAWVITMGNSVVEKLVAITTQLTQVPTSSMALDHKLQTMDGNFSTWISLLDSTLLSMAASRTDTMRTRSHPVTPSQPDIMSPDIDGADTATVPPSDDDGEMAASVRNAPGSTGNDPTSATSALFSYCFGDSGVMPHDALSLSCVVREHTLEQPYTSVGDT